MIGSIQYIPIGRKNSLPGGRLLSIRVLDAADYWKLTLMELVGAVPLIISIKINIEIDSRRSGELSVTDSHGKCSKEVQ